MPINQIPKQDCPQCGHPSNKFAFGPSKLYLGCLLGHVFRVKQVEVTLQSVK